MERGLDPGPGRTGWPAQVWLAINESDATSSRGDLPPGADPNALAEFVTTFMDGIAVQASGGASREELRRAAAIALRVWPAPGPVDGP